MKKCPVCRSQIDNNAMSCVFCGAKTNLSIFNVLLYIAVSLITLSLICLFGIIFEEGDVTARVFYSVAFAIPGIIFALMYWANINKNFPNANKNKMMLIRPGAWIVLIISLIALGWVIIIPAVVGIILLCLLCGQINDCFKEVVNSRKYVITIEEHKKDIIELQNIISNKRKELDAAKYNISELEKQHKEIIDLKKELDEKQERIETARRNFLAEQSQMKKEHLEATLQLEKDRQEIADEKLVIETKQAALGMIHNRQVAASEIAESKPETEKDKRAAFAAELMLLPHIEINVPNIQTVRRDSNSMPAIKFTNITKKTNLKKIFPLVVVDVETTGLSPDNDEIIEVSAIKYNYDFTPSSCFTTLLKPSGHIPSRATEINNITDDMVAGCRSFLEVAPSLSEYISGCNVCGHNLSFDLKFLFCGGVELPQAVKYYDTLTLARRTLIKRGDRKYDPDSGKYEEITDYDVEDHKLTTLCDYYDIQLSDAHRSLSDCLATGKLLKRLIDDKIKVSESAS